MSQRIISTEPVQVAPRNTQRHSISVQMIPSSIVAGNTGLVYGKFGSAPVANINSGTYDFVLNAGAADGSNLYETTAGAWDQQELWLVSDTAGQLVNIVERSITPPATATPSGAAAGV